MAGGRRPAHKPWSRRPPLRGSEAVVATAHGACERVRQGRRAHAEHDLEILFFPIAPSRGAGDCIEDLDASRDRLWDLTWRHGDVVMSSGGGSPRREQRR